MSGDRPSSPGPANRQYIKRKKSSLGDTKVAVIGNCSVGKTALSVRFLTKRFIGEYDQTAETKYKHMAIVDGETVTLEILDTRSTTDDMGLREDVMRWADGFLLVYSVTCRESYDALVDVRRKIEDGKKVGSVPMVLAGNKCDMAHVRQVSLDEGVKLSEDLACPFHEISASEDVTEVTDLFHAVAREVLDFKRRSRTFLDRVFGSLAKKT